MAQPGDRILICMDARMGEVYWATFECDRATGLVVATEPERVGPPGTVIPGIGSINLLAGTGLLAYPQIATQIATRFAGSTVYDNLLPRAREIALLGEAELRAGRGLPAAQAQPVYVRDQVAVAKKM
jgi:tRNA threonylcarbamoyladenosine biosynthesis protein TsaB